MAIEGTDFDQKSLHVLCQPNPDWNALACDCVAFANGVGGQLVIGIEDGDDQPPVHQNVSDSLVEQVRKRIPQLTSNVTISVSTSVAANGGKYLVISIPRSSAIAATSDGRYFIRIADESRRLMPDELQRLLNDKGAFIWESQTSMKIPRQQVDLAKQSDFLAKIRASDRVSDFVKNKSDGEILEHYMFVKDGFLTNLGILWIGRRQDRAVLTYAPVVQFIKYDERGLKVNKLVWDDFTLNPLEMIEAIWTQIPDWRESYEFPDGLFRKQVPHFDEVVVRELLANALVHRPYTMRGDIFINLHPEHLEIHNPGLLPLGVSPANILHASIKRNELLAKTFYDLKLMEREGSGYDRIYETMLASGRPVPSVVEGHDRVMVTVQRRVVKGVVLDFMVKADQSFSLTQKERIALGLIAQLESPTLLDLMKHLELKSAEDTKPWLGRLLDWGIVRTRGRTKGMRYLIDPDLLRKRDFQGRTTLKAIEPHRLRELILSDLRIYRNASIREIHLRVGTEIARKNLQRELLRLVSDGVVATSGDNRWRRYQLDKEGGYVQ